MLYKRAAHCHMLGRLCWLQDAGTHPIWAAGLTGAGQVIGGGDSGLGACKLCRTSTVPYFCTHKLSLCDVSHYERSSRVIWLPFTAVVSCMCPLHEPFMNHRNSFCLLNYMMCSQL